MSGLTPRQLNLLRFVDGFIVERGYSPSFEEMRIGLGLASKSGVWRMVEALKRRGWVRRDFAYRRTIEVVRAPPVAKPRPFRPTITHLSEALDAELIAMDCEAFRRKNPDGERLSVTSIVTLADVLKRKGYHDAAAYLRGQT